MIDLPRVSDVLKILYPHTLDFVQEEHLERGTRLHEEMELIVNNIIYGENYIVSDTVRPLVQWLLAEGIEFQATEEQRSHKYGFTGRPDLLGRWKGQDYCFDYKFAEQITEQNRMQLTAYYQLTMRKTAFLQCPKSGVVKVIKQRPDPSLWSAFMSGLNVWKFYNRKAG